MTILHFVVIPLTHHKNSGYTELKVLGVWALNYPFVYSIFCRCAKGIVIIIIVYDIFISTFSAH